MSKYLGEWAESGYFGMVADFADAYITEEEYAAGKSWWANNEYRRKLHQKMEDALASDTYAGQVIVADYEQGGYEGDAFVLFMRDGKLYEVHGSHCSCYGLEGQWEPEETTVGSLRHRLANSTYGLFQDSAEFRAALESALTAMEDES